MKRIPRSLMVIVAASFLFMLVWDFTPRAAMKGKGKGQDEKAAVPKSSSVSGYRSPSDRHKVTVSDPELAKSIEAQGGRMVADYGSYKLFEVNDAIANTLRNNPAAEITDENNLVLLNAGAIDTTTAAAQSLRGRSGTFAGKRMHLIQFAGPIRPEWHSALAKTGAQIVTYIPSNAFLVYGNSRSLQRAQGLAGIQWDGEYTSTMRLDPSIERAGEKEGAKLPGKNKAGINGSPASKYQAKSVASKDEDLYAIQMVKDPTENAVTMRVIDRLKTEKITNEWEVLNYLNVVVHISAADVVASLSKRPDIVSIAPYAVPVKFDERQNFIIAGQVTAGLPPGSNPNWLTYLAGFGFTQAQFDASNFVINISDSGLDDATQAPNHFGLYRTGDPNLASRVIYNRLEGTPNNPGSTLAGQDGHGNLNSHIIMGFVPNGAPFNAFPHMDAAGYRYGMGVAPFVKIGSSVIFDPDSFTNPNLVNLESKAYNDGARISSNSWGANTGGAYNVNSQTFDAIVRDAASAASTFPQAGNQEYVVVFAAGNAGPGVNTVGAPGSAKNVITAGASENVQAFGGADACGVADTGADNANDIIGFSSRGPLDDGRIKPDLVAPGTHVSGGVWQDTLVNPVSGNGVAAPTFDAMGVCGGDAPDNFFPAGQQWYTASSGTSHSTPAIAGAAALARQFFINQALTPPSPAMTKAVLSNSARYLTGVGANDNLYSNNQGMGEVDLGSFFGILDGSTDAVLKDQLGADMFTASGQQRLVAGNIDDITKPFRVTLAWTDAPGPTSGNAFINNLDLEVTVGGNTYKGNVFTGANSATGGVADVRNNMESVFVPAGVSGTFLVKVKGTNIAGDGVPGVGGPLDQDYALVVYNGAEATVAVLNSGSTAITAESCAPSNNAIDPNETVTVDLGLSNIGTANTTNLVATLQATGGVTSPSGPQNYGAVTAGGAEVVRPFTFTANATCGQIITATLQLQDGATNLGTATFTFQVGVLGAASPTTQSTGNIAVALPDVATVDIPLVVPQTGVAADINVKVRLNHTFDGDLVIALVHPDGTVVNLANSRGGSGDNYGTGANDCSGTPTVFDDDAATAISAGFAPFAGSFRPDGLLSDLDGKNINGTWKLRVTDTAVDDVGTAGCFTLDFSRQFYACCGVPGTPIIVSGGAATITAESIAPANNAPDPGETVTANFPVLNAGDGNTTNLVGTLQTSGGVTPVGSPSRTYGVVLAAGPSVSQPFTFSAAGACGSTITATIHFQDGALDLGNVTYTFQLGTTSSGSSTFSNPGGITIPASGTGATTGAPANPYPSNITVSGITAPVTKVTVKIKGYQHTFPDDVDVLLVGPTGRKFIVYSDTGGDLDIGAPGFDLTFDDEAAAAIADGGPITASGTFKPSNYGTGDAFPAPAPAAPYLSPAPAGADTLATAFAGQDPNGTWSLYVVDDAGVDIGSIAGGWELTITSATPVCNTQACVITCPSNITVPADGSGTGAVINYPNPTIQGACQTINSSPVSGSFFPVGTTTVNITTGAGPNCSFTVTVNPVAATAGQLMISEFRLRGPSGIQDEFVEIYNNSGADHTVTAASGTGYGVAASDGVLRCTIPNATVIPNRGHFLCANNTAVTGYSLGSYPAGDATTATPNATYTTEIADNAGIALFNNNVPANFILANRLDAVGSAGEANTLYKEGTGYPTLSTLISPEYSLFRNMATTGLPKDTDNNAADFLFADTQATDAGAGQHLGAPGPENLSSPIQRNATIKASLVFPCVVSTASPNRVRDLTPVPPNGNLGTLEIRRKFTNNTGSSVTRLRFRIVDITTAIAPGGTADLRALTSTDVSVLAGSNPCGTGALTIRGLTLEEPPTQPNAGGLNSSFSAGIITVGTPIAPGATINLRFLLGVQQGGSFRFFVNVEALP